ncbi:substrate-binding domain-containing protein [Herbaspirillum sp. RTI4]|uniref:substrate-binding domain-containing protein n=1 Tax=Herbaspirillum sp. RTI4 TaxID=3048640 RepID=UPI002AB39D14|nr:substrate-binding domain-containing protein [Herbaspirillum sp. RTI4]MDY7579760.1 substrate-binding domain-containing protein [Herbaspirillum sp. RTI4]MEA9982734.1 substrate-binding domain-containing protein [Herbaspirillum sp. RTI4]
MNQRSRLSTLFSLVVFAFSLVTGSAWADEVRVMNSGGFAAAYTALAPKFEAATGHHLVIIWGPSMGVSPEAIPNRLARGESADVVIMVGYALTELIKQGKAIADSKVELAGSRIGMAVKSGSAKPDISTVAAFKATLLTARSVAYSDSASGVYIENELFKKMGIESELKPKAHKIQKTPVASLVAAGEYELGFQQVSEILPVPGVDFVAKIPEEVQSVTLYSAGIPVGAPHPEAGKALIRFLASPDARAEIIKSGLDPLN